MTAPAIYTELAPRLRDLATLLHQDHDIDRGAAWVHLHGPKADQSALYLVELTRTQQVTIRHGDSLLFRGRVADFYPLANRGSARHKRVA